MQPRALETGTAAAMASTRAEDWLAYRFFFVQGGNAGPGGLLGLCHRLPKAPPTPAAYLSYYTVFLLSHSPTLAWAGGSGITFVQPRI